MASPSWPSNAMGVPLTIITYFKYRKLVKWLNLDKRQKKHANVKSFFQISYQAKLLRTQSFIKALTWLLLNWPKSSCQILANSYLTYFDKIILKQDKRLCKLRIILTLLLRTFDFMLIMRCKVFFDKFSVCLCFFISCPVNTRISFWLKEFGRIFFKISVFLCWQRISCAW